MIISNHAHIFQENVRSDGTLDALRKVMEECGIDKSVCFAPFADYFESNGESPNRWLYEQIKNRDEFIGFGTIDFQKGDIGKQVEEIHELGLRGIKLHPAFQNFHLMCPDACKVYEKAEMYHLPISFHTGMHWSRISNYNTLLYDEVLEKYPELKISMEHVGGYHFFNEAVAVMNNRGRNVYAGLTSVFHKDTQKFWYLGKEKVKELIWLTGIDQCVFGLDFPYNSAAYIKIAMNALNECIDELELGTDAKEKAFGGNLLRMIGE